MAPKRKSDANDDKEKRGSPPKKAAKTSTGTSGQSADKLGLTFKTFEAGAPDLQASISTNASEGSSKAANKAELLHLDLVKQKMSSGSYGWVGAGKRMNVEVEIDGEKRLVQAQVSLNITVLGSKKADEGDNEKDDSE